MVVLVNAPGCFSHMSFLPFKKHTIDSKPKFVLTWMPMASEKWASPHWAPMSRHWRLGAWMAGWIGGVVVCDFSHADSALHCTSSLFSFPPFLQFPLVPFFNKKFDKNGWYNWDWWQGKKHKQGKEIQQRWVKFQTWLDFGRPAIHCHDFEKRPHRGAKICIAVSYLLIGEVPQHVGGYHTCQRQWKHYHQAKIQHLQQGSVHDPAEVIQELVWCKNAEKSESTDNSHSCKPVHKSSLPSIHEDIQNADNVQHGIKHVPKRIFATCEEGLHAFSNRSLLLRDKSIQIVSLLSAETSCKRSLSVISKYTQISVRNVTGFKQCDEHTEKNQKSWCDVWPSQFRGFFCLASMTRAHHRSYSWTQLHGWQTGRLEKPAPVNDSILLPKKKTVQFYMVPKIIKRNHIHPTRTKHSLQKLLFQ